MGAGAEETLEALLERRARQAGSLLCVGLDPPTPERAVSRSAAARAIRDWCLAVVEETAPCAAAFKPNAAYFEALGAEGWSALVDVVAQVPRGIPVILDAKRGDIAESNAAYAQAAFGVVGAHAVTVSPYLGGAALAPFLTRPERGVFVLCRSSNPGAEAVQEADAGGVALFERVAQQARSWSAFPNVGLVAPATDVMALARVRAAAPEAWILVPGVGPQGGSLEAAVAAGRRADGSGMLLNVSRALGNAPDRRAAAARLRDELNRAAEAPRRLATSWTTSLAADLLQAGCVRLGEFTLKSGARSGVYLDLRKLVSHPAILRRVARAYVEVLRTLAFQRVAAIPYAALPIATAVALEAGWPVVYPRREVKDYGTRQAVEGTWRPGETAVLLDDLATTGDSKLEAAERLRAVGLEVRDVVVLVERGAGARAALERAGLRLHAVLTLPALLEELRSCGAVTAEQYQAAQASLGEG